MIKVLDVRFRETNLFANKTFCNILTNATTFGNMNEMDNKGIVINSAFACSAAFAFGGHLAFTSALAPELIGTVIVSKLISGAATLVLALVVTSKKKDSLA